MDHRHLHLATAAALISVVALAGRATAQAPAPPAPPAPTGASPAPTGASPARPLPPLSSAPPPAAPYAPPVYAPPPGYPPAGYGPPGGSPPPGASAPAPEAQPAPAEPARAAAPLPIEIRYTEGRPIPPGYHPETRVRKGLVITGSILFAVPYIFSMSSAASSTYEPDRWLYVPVLGPFIDLAKRGDRCTRSGTFQSSPGVTFTNESCSDDSAARFFIMFDGLMQTAGATMLILGMALPHHLLVRDDAPFSSTGKAFAWTVRPQAMGRAGYGLGVDGTF